MTGDRGPGEVQPKRVCAVVFSYYPADPRPRREAEALIGAGHEVDLICLRDADESPRETVNGVRVFRVPLERKRGGKIRYIWEYALFIVMSFFLVTMRFAVRRYHVVHVHTMPDILVMCALIPKIFGARVFLDLHDPMPEVFMAKYDLAPDSKVVRVLRALERFSIGFANAAITPNEAFRRLFESRGCPENKMHIVMNAPDPSIFEVDGGESQSNAPSDGFAMMYHGTVVERHGLGTALDAMPLLQNDVEGLAFEVFGDGDYVPRFLEKRTEMELDDRVAYHGKVSLEKIAEAIERADVGLIPNLRSLFTEINLPTRIFEYLSKGKPAIVPRTEGILDYFDEENIFFFDPGDPESLADAVRRILNDPDHTAAVVEKGREIYRQHHWSVEKQTLIRLVEDS